MSHSPPLFTSQFSIPYSPSSPLHTLDLHFPNLSSSSANPDPTAHPSSSPKFLLIYVHGGAFRDPAITSRSILASLPALFALPGSPILAVASLNYRLAPYPTHPTAPSHFADPSRNVVWPAPARDVSHAIQWLAAGDGRALWSKSGDGGGDGGGDRGGDQGKEQWSLGGIILAGHSVGATLCLHATPRLGPSQPPGSAGPVRAVVGLAGVYDFTALRDAHPDARAAYEEINMGAFGSETDEGDGEWRGGWERGKVKGGEWRVEGVEVVVLGHGRADELVEMGQAEKLARELENGGGAQREGETELAVRVVECEGNHDEMVNTGKEVGRCVGVAVEVLLERCRKGNCEGS